MCKVIAPEYYPKKLNPSLGFTSERAQYLKENAGVDTALLAADLGVTERFVILFQRRLGLRKCVPAGRRQECR